MKCKCGVELTQAYAQEMGICLECWREKKHPKPGDSETPKRKPRRPRGPYDWAPKEKRARIYGAILKLSNASELPPSRREIMDEARISSTSVVHYWLHRLEREGLIRLIPGKSRGILLTSKGRAMV